MLTAISIGDLSVTKLRHVQLILYGDVLPSARVAESESEDRRWIPDQNRYDKVMMDRAVMVKT